MQYIVLTKLMPSQELMEAIRIFKKKQKLPGFFVVVVVFCFVDSWGSKVRRMPFSLHCHEIVNICVVGFVWHTFVPYSVSVISGLKLALRRDGPLNLCFWKSLCQGVFLAVTFNPVCNLNKLCVFLLLEFLNLWTKMNFCNRPWHLNFYFNLISHRTLIE